jgi:hypothetical protein
MASSFRGCFRLQGLGAAVQSQPLAKSRLNPSLRQTLNNNLEVHTLPSVPVYCVQTGILFAWSPAFIINSSKCKFAYLPAVHFSDLVLNQGSSATVTRILIIALSTHLHLAVLQLGLHREYWNCNVELLVVFVTVCTRISRFTCSSIFQCCDDRPYG